ncbi:MAG: gamma-glutamylcyclotransferase [Lachnospiraceae bacterium]|nr:gamma-glutamylcyclotransferase [Lachnospiraceae bacterium]
MGRKKETIYLAYGSNMNQTQMAFRCPTAEVVGTGELKGYELLFRGVPRGAVATVEPKEGSSVPVLLWKIRRADEQALDRYEGYPRLYGKQMLQVEMDGKEVSAMGYIMTPGREFGIPSDGYADAIWAGYEQCGLDTKPLEDAIHNAYAKVFGQDMGMGDQGQGMTGMGGMEPMG